MDRIQAEIEALESIVRELDDTPASRWRRRKYLNELRRGQDALVVSLLKDKEAVVFGQLAKALTGQ
jgi:hypothetical protein